MDVSLFPPLTPSTTGNTYGTQIERLIRAAISAGHIAPGNLLPSRAVLANHWGVAQMTVQRAMQGLCDDLIVEPAQGVGWRVLPTDVQPPPGRWCAVMDTGDALVCVPGFLSEQAATDWGHEQEGDIVLSVGAAEQLNPGQFAQRAARVEQHTTDREGESHCDHVTS